MSAPLHQLDSRPGPSLLGQDWLLHAPDLFVSEDPAGTAQLLFTASFDSRRPSITQDNKAAVVALVLRGPAAYTKKKEDLQNKRRVLFRALCSSQRPEAFVDVVLHPGTRPDHIVLRVPTVYPASMLCLVALGGLGLGLCYSLATSLTACCTLVAC